MKKGLIALVAKVSPRTKEAKKLVAVVSTATFFIVMIQILITDQQETVRKYSQVHGSVDELYLSRLQR